MQVLLPTPIPTLAEAVAPIILTTYTALGVSHLCSAVVVVIVLVYTTADQEMKLEWSVLVSVLFLYVPKVHCMEYQHDKLSTS